MLAPTAGDQLQRESPAAPPLHERPRVAGKFLFVGSRKLYIRGVTYGPFGPGADGCEYRDAHHVRADFARMSENGINTVRVYTVPPRWLLDVAFEHGLYVMVGLPWEQHVAFLEEESMQRDIERRVREGVRACAGHPAVLCYAIGNEIPAPIVRWHGRAAVSRFLKRLYRAAKQEDPQGLVTYVNYPTTEHLDLPFVDLLCFNVYLESQDRLEAYIARLHNLADEKPLVLAEVGLDSRRNGVQQQADTLHWQIRSIFSQGCAGAFIFAWTDLWHRGGCDIDDWDFGLVDRAGEPKPALAAVRDAFAQTPFADSHPWPRISVVVCTYNGARTLTELCARLRDLDYPDYEVIVVNDGSTDQTEAIAERSGFHVITTRNGGLSRARNTGMRAATGEIVAYIDDDAWPDPHWLKHLAVTFADGDYVGVGGPNLPPPGDGLIADCVANAPGGPSHVLLDDRIAEHIPGCNMAFRRDALEAVGGFDPQFRIAGDDVDLCWRVQQQCWNIGFCPAAVVWHHRRDRLRAYWRQQFNYGRAEAMLERKWPHKYNVAGHVPWSGRLYSRGLLAVPTLHRGRVYQGTWGAAPFQRLYAPAPGILASLPMMPEWHLLVATLALLALLGFSWPPLFGFAPLVLGALIVPLIVAASGVARAGFDDHASSAVSRIARRGVTALLHLTQPIVRLYGRVSYGLTPWRRRGRPCFHYLNAHRLHVWSQTWRSHDQWLTDLKDRLQTAGAQPGIGGDYDNWDISVRGGLFGMVRVRSTVEEHGGGNQLLRFAIVPVWRQVSGTLFVLLAAMGVAAGISGAWLACQVLLALALLCVLRAWYECGAARQLVQDGVAMWSEDGLGATLLNANVACRPGRTPRPDGHGALRDCGLIAEPVTVRAGD